MRNIIESMKKGKVYNVEKKKWITAKEKLQQMYREAEKGEIDAIKALEFLENLSKEEKLAWIGVATNINAIANMEKKSVYEIDLSTAIEICKAWDAERFMIGYLAARKEYINNKGRKQDGGYLT